MKTKQVLTVMITSLFLLYGCSNSEGSVEELGLTSKNSTLAKSEPGSNASGIHRAYPKEKAEVLATFGAIATSIVQGAGHGYGTGSDPLVPNDNIDQLISFHDYSGYYFTEFNNGGSYHATENEAHERALFGDAVDEGGVQKFAAVPGTLKVAVFYGNVANLTFISDFELFMDGQLHIVNNLITLLFVKTGSEWKMVHEHHSPVNVEEPGVGSDNYTSEKDPADFNETQNQVYATFGAIRQSIIDGAGKGYDSEFMDQLISFHTYGPKFVEFNNGESFDSEGNEHNERQLFGENLVEGGVKHFFYAPGTLNIEVYHGNVANLTFVSDFILDIKDGPTDYRVNNLITLLFVKTKGEWKLVHEHHSPYAGPEITWPIP